MRRPEKKLPVLVIDAMDENSNLITSGYNQACDDWERYLANQPYFQDGDDDKYVMVTDVKNTEEK